jgi:phospholipase C
MLVVSTLLLSEGKVRSTNMKRYFAVYAALVLACVATLVPATKATATTTSLNRIFVVYMENQGFDDVIGHDDANGNPDTPYITSIALKYGLDTLYFGVTHPSLPNYLALIGGYTNNISDDNNSCYAPSPGPGCHSIPYINLVDQLESKHISWAAYEQSMPTPGYLGSRYPTSGPVLYAQKHNPFVYYTDIATNPSRRDKVLPLDNNATQLHAALANAATAPRFVFIAPDQCHDMHGTTTCTNYDALLREGDIYLHTLVQTITSSPSFTSNSALFIVWDENDYSSNLGCCSSPQVGGGHIAAIVITPRYTHPIQSAALANHYNLLHTIESAYGLAPLNKAGTVPASLFELLP